MSGRDDVDFNFDNTRFLPCPFPLSYLLTCSRWLFSSGFFALRVSDDRDKGRPVWSDSLLREEEN